MNQRDQQQLDSYIRRLREDLANAMSVAQTLKSMSARLKLDIPIAEILEHIDQATVDAFDDRITAVLLRQTDQ